MTKKLTWIDHACRLRARPVMRTLTPGRTTGFSVCCIICDDCDVVRINEDLRDDLLAQAAAADGWTVLRGIVRCPKCGPGGYLR